MASQQASDPPEGQGPERFDDILARLRQMVDRLESGNLSLEDSLRCFEEGMQLCRKGAGILDGAEKRVETLLASPDGRVRVEAFDTRGGPGNDRNGSE
jgi:exodeoxyribonuclease VII small subunit